MHTPGSSSLAVLAARSAHVGRPPLPPPCPPAAAVEAAWTADRPPTRHATRAICRARQTRHAALSSVLPVAGGGLAVPPRAALALLLDLLDRLVRGFPHGAFFKLRLPLGSL